MSSVLTSRGNLDTETNTMCRWRKYYSDTSTSQWMPKIASNHQKLVEGPETDSSSLPSKQTHPADIIFRLDLDFWPSESGGNIFLLFKSPSLWYTFYNCSVVPSTIRDSMGCLTRGPAEMTPEQWEKDSTPPPSTPPAQAPDPQQDLTQFPRSPYSHQARSFLPEAFPFLILTATRTKSNKHQSLGHKNQVI